MIQWKFLDDYLMETSDEKGSKAMFLKIFTVEASLLKKKNIEQRKQQFSMKLVGLHREKKK